ncbi:unnamed protein product [Adineta steineri]|uniref:Uncharacterized protein n=1 Tax=Adineta steineri TaxID=433720 RepID=A0A813YEE9_9BILA|nr:unnamed protein product [Adineta steineri]CAF0885403.1 unnamed protein product [Adineta steineri]
MQPRNDRSNSDALDVDDHHRQKEELLQNRESFLRKYFHKAWPKKLVFLLGMIQLAISLCILGVDLPIILMFAPRWQVLCGVWTFICGFIAAASTMHSARKLTWVKLEITAALNVLGAIAAAISLIFNIMFASNPYSCIIASGCNYLNYTYTQGTSFYIGELVLDLLFIATVIVYLVLFVKYGVGAKSDYDKVQRGYQQSSFSSLGPNSMPPRMPMYRPRPPPNMMSETPRPGFMPRYPGQAPRGMMGPRGPMMRPGMRGPPQQSFRQPGPYQNSVRGPMN